MKQLAVQIQFKKKPRDPCIDFLDYIVKNANCKEVGRSSLPDYVTLNLETDDLKALWDWISKNMKDFEENLLVVCQGDIGWEDALLLYSFDEDEEIDIL